MQALHPKIGARRNVIVLELPHLTPSTSLYLTVHYSNMALLHSTRICIILSLLYFTQLDSTLLHHGSTSLYFTLHYSTMALLHSTRLYITQSWLYYNYLILHNSTQAQLHSTRHYITLPWFYITVLDSTLLYHASTSVY